ncbi:hypothetical protein BVRB_5g100120 [Beta vulgaris subsp. vulgaris]|nr:hypothetical protein BVRB_5g100120 [Beta vulgaris subsp. vulgaris]
MKEEAQECLRERSRERAQSVWGLRPEGKRLLQACGL